MSKKYVDMIVPFQLNKGDARGQFVRLEKTLTDIMAKHNYPVEVEDILGEAVILTALIGQSIKSHWKLSLQIRGDGPIRILATDLYGSEKKGEVSFIRAYASVDEERLAKTTGTSFDKIGKGMFAMIIDQGPNTEPYQGISPLKGGSLSKCAEMFFEQSEQLATRFMVATGRLQTGDNKSFVGGGLMLQHLPTTERVEGEEDEAGNLSLSYGEHWQRITMLLDTVENSELLDTELSAERLIYRLFNEEDPERFPEHKVEFACSCSEDKVRQTMSIYSTKDIEKMTDPSGMVTADCQFCGAHYELEPTTLGFEAVKE